MRSLRRFLAAAATFPGAPGLASSIEMATVLQNVIQRDLLPDPELANPIPGRPRGGRTTNSLKVGLHRAKSKARGLEKEIQDLKTRVSRSIATRWFVVAGLGDPATSTRSVESWCREVALGEADYKPISHASVSVTRDAFGTLLLRMNKSDVQRYLQTSKRRFVLLSHQHDEATMRLRSTLPPGAAAPAAPPAATPAAPPAAAPAARPAAAPAVSPYQRRTRSSKVQNAVVTLHGGSNLADSLLVLLELQALAKKDAVTIATALHFVAAQVQEAARAMDGHLRLLHVVIGDNVSTNQLAARLLWQWMQRDGHKLYRLISITCSTHASNLAVKTAICGVEKPTGAIGPDGDKLVAACVRFF